ncbi:MAG TPA: hypothetical protein VK936_07440 [Longimicrobiales bacterium]|nr:hypothetical protein [Longimicrobiales bacterium]
MRALTVITAATLVVGQAGCDLIERRSGDAEGQRLVLSLQAPEVLDWGGQGTVRLALRNDGDSATVARVELHLPPWIEFGSVEPAGTEVTLLSEAEGTRLSYTTAPLQPGEQWQVLQHIRVPDPDRPGPSAAPARSPMAPVADTTAPTRPPPTNRVVRARLVSEDGNVRGAEVQAVLAFRGAPDSPSMVQDAGVREGDVRIESDGVGPVRLGMTADSIRRSTQGARDTTLAGAGSVRERGIVTRLADGTPAVAVVGDGGVERIILRDARLRTPEGFGAGSPMGELRTAYGQACAEALPDGRAAVWFLRAPGLSFVVDAGLPTQADRTQLDPARIPDDARASELWITQRRDGC